MTKLRKAITLILFICVAAPALYGCEDSNSTPQPRPPTGGDAKTVVTAAHKAMSSLESFHFTVQSLKDGGTTLTIEGDVEPPDKARSVYQQPGNEKGELVVFGKDSYLKPPGAPVFVGTPGGNDPLLAVNSILYPVGLTYYALLADSASLVADEMVDGVDTTHVTFSFSPAKVKVDAAKQENQPTPEPQEGELGTYKGDMWVEHGTNYVRKLQWLPPARVEATPAAAGTPEVAVQRTVAITFSKFNEPVSPPIQVPAAAVTKTPSPTPIPEEP